MALIPGLVRPAHGGMIGGVCAAIANYLKIDVGTVRAVWVIAVLFAGMGLWVYPLAWLVIPEEGADHAGIDTVLDRAKVYAADAKARRDQATTSRPSEVFNP